MGKNQEELKSIIILFADYKMETKQWNWNLEKWKLENGKFNYYDFAHTCLLYNKSACHAQRSHATTSLYFCKRAAVE